MARVFEDGDFRSGYYRDQTFMFAAGMATIEQFFAQLYAIPDVEEDPFSAGRQMNAISPPAAWMQKETGRNCAP